MAAPTNVRVEAVTAGVNMLRWTYVGAAALKVYRSINGSAYTLVATLATDIREYTDTGLDNATKYWYKVSDDSGTTYSSVVTVVTITIGLAVSRPDTQLFTSRAIDGVTVEDIPLITDQLDINSARDEASSTPCIVCPVDKAVIFDCRSGCRSFIVDMTDDINSISAINCPECPDVQFIVPEGETFGICGWPFGCGYVGDECFQSPIEGPRKVYTDGTSSPITPPDGSGGGKKGPCPCIEVQPFQIQCCEETGNDAGEGAGSCTLECPPTIFSNQGKTHVKLRACGGVEPYTWGVVDGIVSVSDGSRRAATYDVGNEFAQLKNNGKETITVHLSEKYCESVACVGLTVIIPNQFMAPCCGNDLICTGPFTTGAGGEASSDNIVTCTNHPGVCGTSPSTIVIDLPACNGSPHVTTTYTGVGTPEMHEEVRFNIYSGPGCAPATVTATDSSVPPHVCVITLIQDSNRCDEEGQYN